MLILATTGLKIRSNRALHIRRSGVDCGLPLSSSGSLVLKNTLGQLLLSATIPAQQQMIEVNTSNLSNGIYLVSLSLADRVVGMAKLVVQH